jgi:hypothetical protein
MFWYAVLDSFIFWYRAFFLEEINIIWISKLTRKKSFRKDQRKKIICPVDKTSLFWYILSISSICMSVNRSIIIPAVFNIVYINDYYILYILFFYFYQVLRHCMTRKHGDVAHLVERSLCMREAPGSMPGISIQHIFFFSFFPYDYTCTRSKDFFFRWIWSYAGQRNRIEQKRIEVQCSIQLPCYKD